MKKIIIILFYLVLALFFAGCSNSDNSPTENKSDLSKGISGITTFNYEYLSTAPIHTQTSMLSGYQGKLYRYGARWPLQILDLTTNTWSEIQLPDSTYWRWDGAEVTIGENIYIVATSVASQSYDILKLNLNTSTLEHTNTNLPTDFHYPAYCVNDNNIIFLYKGSQKTYEYDTIENKIKEISSNPFYSTTDINLTLSSGKYDNYLYVFGGYSDLPKNLFYRMDLTNYNWEKLDMPADLENKNLFGSVFGEQLILFSDSISTYEYSFPNNSWYEDTLKVPIYSRGSDGSVINAEWSFYSDGPALYGTEIISNKVWKITK